MPIYKSDDINAIHCILESLLDTLVHEWTKPLTAKELEDFFSGMVNHLYDLQEGIEETKRREEAIRAQVAADAVSAA